MTGPSATSSSVRRAAGVAGLVYVTAAAVENMEAFTAATRASPAADVRAMYADRTLALVTTAAGVVSLLAYAVFVLALVGVVWAGSAASASRRLALAGGLGAAALAAAALGSSAVLASDGGAGRGDAQVESIYTTALLLRTASGPLLALFLATAGAQALRERTLPRGLAGVACALAVPLALTPLGALDDGQALDAAVRAAFSLQVAWVAAAALWLTVGGAVPVVTFVRRAAFLLLVIAAGSVGIALLIAPGATLSFFSWRLAPEPLAAFAGGVYVGSAATYLAGLPCTERQARGLVLGAAVLSVSVLAITLTHLDPFDFSRGQAWAWVVLFGAFSAVMVVLSVAGVPENLAQDEPAVALASWTRRVFAVLCGVLTAGALALWIAPGAVAGPNPFALAPLGGRFAGSWLALLAVLAGWAALRNRGDEARLSALALVLLPAGVLLGALRTLPDLRPASAGLGYLAAWAMMWVSGALVLTRDPAVRGRGSPAGRRARR
jgi:hypothetical protein